jgi:hypothetical protein
MAGIVLVSDMTVNVFLASGSMVELMYQAGGYKNFDDFCEDCVDGLRESTVNKINKVIKNSKVRLTHLNHLRKAKKLGPPANHRSSSFDYNGENIHSS